MPTPASIAEPAKQPARQELSAKPDQDLHNALPVTLWEGRFAVKSFRAAAQTAGSPAGLRRYPEASMHEQAGIRRLRMHAPAAKAAFSKLPGRKE